MFNAAEHTNEANVLALFHKEKKNHNQHGRKQPFSVEIAESTNQSYQGDRQNRFTTLKLFAPSLANLFSIEYETLGIGDKND